MNVAISLPVAAFLATALAVSAHAGPETVWTGATGNWSSAADWSEGEPVADCPAVIASGSVTVNQAGEACASLQLGSASGAFVPFLVQGGSLAVGGTLTVAGANVTHGAGAVTAERLQCGGQRAGTYTMSGGSLTVTTCILGSQPLIGSLSVSPGQFTVQDSLHVGQGGSIILFGSATVADLGNVVVRGVFTVSGRSQTMTADSFVMQDFSRLHAGAVIGGVGLIQVSGRAVLNGTLEVQVTTNIPNGTFEFLRAGTLEGTFDDDDLPGPEWSWFIQGNSLFLKKDDLSPVERTSWSSIKAGTATGLGEGERGEKPGP